MKHGDVTRATVRDVAAATGVSIATVSRVLNRHGNVAPQTRALVERAVERLGARAPGPRRAPAAPPAGPILVRCPYLLTDYFGLIVSSIAETLDLHGRRLVLDAGQAAQRTGLLDRLPARGGDIGGTILVLPPEPAADLATLHARRRPLVVVDPRTPPPRDMVAVSAAHAAGARALTAHLTALGHRRIGVIAGPSEWLASDARLAGHAAALADAGVLGDPALVRYVRPTVEEGHGAAADLLDGPDRPTALVGFNDKVAVGALRAAAERGLRVPGDLSVAGFDDIDLSRATRPALTTVRQPLQEMGRMAVTLLERQLGRHSLEALHVELATELVVRDSTGPA
ncbi:LacI family DNA-binding transcriptional regulator [Spirilliplanes yamanashiensis]|uniref:LacI family transcriptional regulator n=1 Tax=Spirilliplanes yamanashiensis TaxID=42233 RepID=A0A8J3YCG7_9ACTN|nr:substrate-binding domain-containing protein [Spirilliplanes yamanashiensis]MDP9819100.1 LacI family transcriptional regulator [Spirilliplanes yamanashiensis]GIJ05554.1 LacI family transcriptional regulator [Spirilliplanes yamanashiensis]